MKPLRIAGVQMDVRLGDVSGNLTAIASRAKTAVQNGAAVVIFPECAVTGYCFDSLAAAREPAESIPGPSSERLVEICRDLGCHLVVGTLEAGPQDQVYNVALLVGPDGVISKYRKTHLPFLGVDRFTTPGEGPYEVATAGDLRVGLNICYDATFPEAARALMLGGADLIALPTNWPPGSEPAAQYVINARALENKTYYAAVNRVGVENGFEFIGASRICGPSGETLAEAPDRNETILYAEIDPEKARNKHVVRVPKGHEIHRLRDRRPDLYGALTQPLEQDRFRGDT